MQNEFVIRLKGNGSHNQLILIQRTRGTPGTLYESSGNKINYFWTFDLQWKHV